MVSRPRPRFITGDNEELELRWKKYCIDIPLSARALGCFIIPPLLHLFIRLQTVHR